VRVSTCACCGAKQAELKCLLCLAQAIGGIVLALAGLNIVAAILRPKTVRHVWMPSGRLSVVYVPPDVAALCTAGVLQLHPHTCAALLP
jgi:hypothetical protein